MTDNYWRDERTDLTRELAAAILEHAVPAEELAVRRIRARIAELEPLLAFGGGLGAVYAAEIAGLRYALALLEEDPPRP